MLVHTFPFQQLRVRFPLIYAPERPACDAGVCGACNSAGLPPASPRPTAFIASQTRILNCSDLLFQGAFAWPDSRVKLPLTRQPWQSKRRHWRLYQVATLRAFAYPADTLPISPCRDQITPVDGGGGGNRTRVQNALLRHAVYSDLLVSISVSPATQTIYTNLIRVNLFSLQRIRKLRKVRPAVKTGLPLPDSGDAAHAVAKQQLHTYWRGDDAGVDHHDVRVCGDVVLHFSLTPALRSLH